MAPVMVLAQLLTVIGCRQRLDQSDCDRLAEKMIDLLAKGESHAEVVNRVQNELKADKRSQWILRNVCVGKMTKTQFDCVFAAKTFEEATGCSAK
ncbi:MAG: hypothetical protein NVSMB1_18070 [Polyangiales bacterium]